VNRGARGHSSLKAAIDTELEVSVAKKRPGFWINATKQRDMELMPGISYQLVSVQLGVDDDGDPVSSCIVEFAGDLETVDEVQKLSPAEEHVLGVLNSLESEPLPGSVIEAADLEMKPNQRGFPLRLVPEQENEASDLEMKPNQRGFPMKLVRKASLKLQADEGRDDQKLNTQYFRRGLKALKDKEIIDFDKHWVWFLAADDLESE